MHRKHLQEILDQSSNVTTRWDSSKTSELLSEKEEVDSENIPQELLSSPTQKWLKSRGSDKDFVIIRRTKLNQENFPDVSTLVRRCPNLVHLDLNDSVKLKHDCFPEFLQLSYLQHLSLSRFFGIVPDGILQLLGEALPHLQINFSYFTTIPRPTVGNKKNLEIWGIRCQVTLCL
ncbi:hypothetical protein H1C71_018281 [Ictidomys tridecemlineatus]|uniref:Uncharacterized protein n=1 Tax=Ictidomys tridecemlineatus TaxID=43179 RepID=A0A287D9L4_ICTTR|nr:hypothetical protein H1C71_018281 [Ictidomys tridecemlineatus]